MPGAGLIGAGALRYKNRRRSQTQPISAVVLPASSDLVAGQSLSDTPGWPVFLDPSNYATSVPGAQIAAVVVNYIGTAQTATAPLAAGDTNAFSVTVTDTAGSERTFATIPRILLESPPQVIGTLADQSLTAATGPQTYAVAAAFSGTALSFTLEAPAGVSIDSASGLVTFDTDVLALQAGTPITVTATNAGGTAAAGFALSLTAAITYSATISGAVINPTHGPAAQIGIPLSGEIPELLGSETVLHRWTAGGTAIAGADTASYTPQAGDDLTGLRYAPLVDGTGVVSPELIVRHAPPVAGTLVPVTSQLGAGTPIVNLDAGFSGAALVYSEAVDWASVAGGTLVIDDALRSDSVTITATNSGGAAEVRLDVTITPAPVTLDAPIADQVLLRGSGPVTIDLDTVFGNATGYAVSGSGAVSLDPDGVTLRIDDGAVIRGDTVTVSATNAAGTVQDQFSLTVQASVETDFIMTIRTTTPNETFRIQTRNGRTYNANVDFGDGTTASGITTPSSASWTNTYATPGTYTVRISGQCGALFFNGGPDGQKIRTIENLGVVGWQDFQTAFYDCRNMTSFIAGNTDTSGVANFFAAFSLCNALRTADITGMITQTTENLQNMFAGCFALNNLIGLNTADTRNVRRMDEMLFRCRALPPEQIDISGFSIESLQPAGGGFNFIEDSPLSPNLTVEIYDAFLLNAGSQTLQQSGIWLGFNNSDYTRGGAAEAARRGLIASVGFRINDAGNAPPEMPGDVALAVVDTNVVTITLPLDPFTNGRPVNRRDIRYSADGGATWTEVTGIVSPYDLTGLTDNTTYQVQWRAVNADGAGTWSNSRAATTLTAIAAPDQMGPPSLTVLGSDSIRLDKAPDPNTNGAPITSHDYRYSTDEATWTLVADFTSPEIIGALSAGTTYFVQTRAVAAGATPAEGAWSLSASAVTSAADGIAPVLSLPAGLASGATGATALGVSTDEGNGTLFWGIYPAASAPVAASVVAGTGATVSGSQAVSAAGAQSVPNQSGLTALTAYRVHYVHDDAAGNRSAVATAPAFTTETAGTLSVTNVSEDLVISEYPNGTVSLSIGAGDYAGTYATRASDGAPLTVVMIEEAAMSNTGVCVKLPEVRGLAQAGQTLTILPGLWIALDSVVASQTWVSKVGGVPTGETDLDYLVREVDEDSDFTVEETFGGATATSAATPLGVPTFGRVVFVGASIMRDLFPSSDLVTRNPAMEAAFAGEGATVEVYCSAGDGETLNTAATRLTAALAQYPADTLFVVHSGGNSVSSNRPYPGGASAIQSGLTALVDIAATRPGAVILSDLSFRDYGDTTAVNENAGAKPYNDNIWRPTFQARKNDLVTRAYYADGTPVTCFYEWSFAERATWLGPDNVHPSASGLTAGRAWLAERLAPILRGAALPAQVDRTDIDRTAPVLTGTLPADNATGIAVNSAITLTFSEQVKPGTGSLVLRDAQGGWSDREIFDVETGLGSDGGSVTVSGAVVTIVPGSNMAAGTAHALRIGATALDDLSNNSFAGIADDATLSFTTAAASSTDIVVNFAGSPIPNVNLVDVGEFATGTTAPLGPLALVNLDGGPSGASLTITPSRSDAGMADGFGPNIDGGATGQAGFDNSLYNDEIVGENLFVEAGDTASFRISGLAPGTAYIVEAIGSRVTGEARETRLDFGGGVTLQYPTSATTPVGMTGQIVTSDASGTISFTMSAAVGGYAHISGLRISSEAFDFDDIPGLVGWYAADDAATITQSGGFVTGWADKSSSAHDLGSGGLANTERPQTGTRSINGRNALEWDGAARRRLYRSDALGFTGNPAMTIVVVADIDAAGSSIDPFVFLGRHTNPTAGACLFLTGGSSGYSFRYNNGNKVFGGVSTGPQVLMFSRAAGATYDAGHLRINGGAAQAQTSAASPTSTLALTDSQFIVGASVNSAGAANADLCNMALGLVLVFDRDLSPDEADRVMRRASALFSTPRTTVK